jgi:hypothetical protein
MTKENEDMKLFSIRLPKDVWIFLKKTSADQGIPMSEIVIRLLEKYRKKIENKLT